MAKSRQVIIRYSHSFKQKVVQEIEREGLKVSEAARRYGIAGCSTVTNWLSKFGRNQYLNQIVRVEMKGEKDRLKELEEENKRLKIALADKTMQKDVLETLIEIVNEHYQTDVKKNLGPKGSVGSGKKKGGR